MGVGVVIHHVFKQWRGGRGCVGLMTVPLCGLCRLSERIRLAVVGHLERRGHIAHIKGGWESRSVCLAMGWWREWRGSWRDWERDHGE